MKYINEIAELLKNKYLIETQKIEKSEDSTDGNVYFAHSESDKFIVKIYKNLTHAKSMIDLHSCLVKESFNVPSIITSKSVKFATLPDKSVAVVYSFLQGEQIGWKLGSKDLNDSTIKTLANTLYKMHFATCGANKFNLPKLPFEASKTARNSALHFDLTKGNIFVNGNKIGLIDFDDAKYGDSVCDVAIAVSNLFFSKTRGVDTDSTKLLIDEYYRNDPAAKKLELPLIKEYALRWIDYLLDNNDFDTSNKESFQVRRKLIESHDFGH